MARLSKEFAHDFTPNRPVHVSTASGRIDVMGGIVLPAGATAYAVPTGARSAVAVQPRNDQQLQAVSLNRLDSHEPFTFRVPMGSLVGSPQESLAIEFAQPGRQWAALLAGPVSVMVGRGWIDPTKMPGLDVAALSDVPSGRGLGASTSIAAAATQAIAQAAFAAGAWTGPDLKTAARLAARPNAGNARGAATLPGSTIQTAAGSVEQAADIASEQSLSAADRITGADDLADVVMEVERGLSRTFGSRLDACVALYGTAGEMLVARGWPVRPMASLPIPLGIRIVAIDTGVDEAGANELGVAVRAARMPTAAAMGHAILLEKMRQMGRRAGRQLVADPMDGLLGNLPLDDYKKFFREYLPESIKGGPFLLQYGSVADGSARIHPDRDYAVQGATDHWVWETTRCRNFGGFFEEAGQLPPHTSERSEALDKSGHLMYASHVSMGECVRLGNDPSDTLVELVRRSERKGLYGARITARGGTSPVAVLCAETTFADAAIATIMETYTQKTGLKPTLIEAADSSKPATGH